MTKHVRARIAGLIIITTAIAAGGTGTAVSALAYSAAHSAHSAHSVTVAADSPDNSPWS